MISIASNKLILDVGGVGYGLEMTPRCLTRVASTELAEVFVHTHVREDQIKLFGFATGEEKALFGLFLSLSRIGPKLALAMLSKLSVTQVITAVAEGDAKALEAVSWYWCASE